jgi:general stress protein 26
VIVKKNELDHNSETHALDPIKKLAQLIKGIKFAMMTTANPDGTLYSRPMACQEVDFDGDLWFFTSKTSGKIYSIMNDQHVNLGFSQPDQQQYISVCGRAEIVEDRAQAKKLWSPFYKAWFPEGLDDPNLVLLKIQVESAEYWASPSSMVVKLVGFAKALLTGENFSAGEHQHLNIHH